MLKSQLISSKMLYEGGQYRDSVTMSYYAMYSSALALLLKKSISPKTHEGTLRPLAKEYVKIGLLSKETYGYLYDVTVIQKLLQKKMLKNLFYRLKNSLMKWKLYYDFF
ncbi:HEPN domain-containing protein [Methanobrevibacter sp. UBA212]|uniref:HEPN domain-containing protein n=1 Tax=Methanobrevibacter sp. UBA212 TaxID=1915476 RepID=UPI0025F5692E|nr:HEPN domain-containing protein [Methanobrevibacter sp. UBA212]